MKFEFDKRTGMMIPKKNEQIYFASSVGGGLRVDDRKHNVKFIVERNGKITNIAGIYDSSVNLYDFNDARVIADRVARMFGRNHKYADYHYFLKGVVRESEVMDFDGYVNEMWGDVLKRDLLEETREEDKFHNKKELKEYLKSEIEKQGENVVIRDLDVSLIEDFNYLFYGIANGVKTLDLSGWKTSNVKNMSDMFSNCKNITSLDLSDWDTSNVENMWNMFNYCESLKSLDLSGWDTSNVNNMWSMFNECKNLKSLDISGWDTSNVNNMTRMFNYCESLKSLDISGWDTANVEGMNQMFARCKSLESLDLSGWDTSNVKDMRWMFSECESLKSLDLSGWDISNVEKIEGIFDGCDNCKILKPSSKHLRRDKFQSLTQLIRYLESEIIMQGKNVVIKDLDVSQIEDLSCLFDDIAVGVNSLDLSGWKTSNVKDMRYMFGGCKNLKSLDLSGWDTSNVEGMRYMFSECESLKSLDLSGWDVSSVKDMNHMFYSCWSLKSLDVSGWDTSNVENMSCMFDKCSGLKSLDISGWDTSKVEDMSCMFYGCKNLKLLDISDWDTSNVKDMRSMFYDSPVPYKIKGNKIVWA